VTPRQKIIFDVESGNVSIRSHAGHMLEFSWHLLSGNKKYVTVKTLSSTNAVFVTAKVRNSHFGPGTSIQIDASVPDASRLELETAGGSIGVAAHDGPMTMQASGGNVAVDAARGPMEVTVSGGSLRVGRAAAGLRASVTGGSASVGSSSGKVDIGVTGGTASVVDDDAAPQVSLGSTGGSATLAVPRQARFHLHAEATGGFVQIAPVFLGGASVTTNPFDGTVHGGGGSVQLNATGGSVSLVPN
jgi:hypothetical protein